MCTSTRAVIAVCVCAREREPRRAAGLACHVWSGAGPARESFKASSLCWVLRGPHFMNE